MKIIHGIGAVLFLICDVLVTIFQMVILPFVFLTWLLTKALGIRSWSESIASFMEGIIVQLWLRFAYGLGLAILGVVVGFLGVDLAFHPRTIANLAIGTIIGLLELMIVYLRKFIKPRS